MIRGHPRQPKRAQWPVSRENADWGHTNGDFLRDLSANRWQVDPVILARFEFGKGQIRAPHA
jgi:hypothetical protein